MAEKRMFAKSIVLSDAFLDMPTSARCLYFTLGMLADDDGFIGNPKSIMRQIAASQDDMLLLLQKRYVLSFESGVIVIKHWRINNYLQKDRYKETTYLEEKAQLEIDGKGAYTEKEKEMYTECIQNVYTDKNSIDKNSIDYININILSSTRTILDYLNQKAGTNYKASTKSTQNHINARFKEGFNEEDFKAVIDFKVSEWGNDKKMSMYLRPQTLFGTKFESYLNQANINKPKNDYGIQLGE